MKYDVIFEGSLGSGGSKILVLSDDSTEGVSQRLILWGWRMQKRGDLNLRLLTNLCQSMFDLTLYVIWNLQSLT